MLSLCLSPKASSNEEKSVPLHNFVVASSRRSDVRPVRSSVWALVCIASTSRMQMIMPVLTQYRETYSVWATTRDQLLPASCRRFLMMRMWSKAACSATFESRPLCTLFSLYTEPDFGGQDLCHLNFNFAFALCCRRTWPMLGRRRRPLGDFCGGAAHRASGVPCEDVTASPTQDLGPLQKFAEPGA